MSMSSRGQIDICELFLFSSEILLTTANKPFLYHLRGGAETAIDGSDGLVFLAHACEG
jgi:hypothetical protein